MRNPNGLVNIILFCSMPRLFGYFLVIFLTYHFCFNKAIVFWCSERNDYLKLIELSPLDCASYQVRFSDCLYFIVSIGSVVRVFLWDNIVHNHCRTGIPANFRDSALLEIGFSVEKKWTMMELYVENGAGDPFYLFNSLFFCCFLIGIAQRWQFWPIYLWMGWFGYGLSLTCQQGWKSDMCIYIL